MALRILATPTFGRAIKKLHARDKKAVDKAVAAIAEDAAIGMEKKGDLAGVFVYKFKVSKQEVLLAYALRPDKYKPKELVLLSFGSHENFYAALKK